MATTAALLAAACFSEGGEIATSDAESTGTSGSETTGPTASSTSSSDTGSDDGPTTGPSMTTTTASASATDTTTGQTDDGPGVCDGVCVSEIPGGWLGPLALWMGDAGSEAPGCMDAYGTDAGSFFADLDPGTAECECTCDDATGIVCSDPVGVCFHDGGVSCFAVCMSPTNIPPATCTTVSVGGTTHVSASNPAPTNAGSCNPVPNHTLDTPSWATHAQACATGLASPEGCEAAEVCAPETTSPFERLCIAHEGDTPCPAGTFTDKHVLYEDYEDTRECSACTCGPADSSCDGTVYFLNSAGGICNVFVDSVDAGGCSTHGGATRVEYTPDPSGTCPPQGGNLTGEATPTGATTFCCMP